MIITLPLLMWFTGSWILGLLAIVVWPIFSFFLITWGVYVFYLRGEVKLLMQDSPSVKEHPTPQSVDELEKNLQNLVDFLKKNPTAVTTELIDLFSKTDLTAGIIVAKSDTVVGRLGDTDILEWIDLYDNTSKKIERFFYEGIAQKDNKGEIITPELPGKVSTALGGVIYARDANSASAG